MAIARRIRRLLGVAVAGSFAFSAACGPLTLPAPSNAAPPSGAVAPALPADAETPAAGSAIQAAPGQETRPVPVRAVTVNAFPPPQELGGRNWTYYPETGHYVANGFKAYFDAGGGPGSLGFPITEALVEDGWTVQYFQRARLEYHPETPAAPVQRALLGDMLLKAYATGQDPRGALRPGAAPPDGARLFPETQTWVAPPVLDFYDRNGGLDTFGYPAAGPGVDEQGACCLQWFQRARIEWTGSGGDVHAALIGDEYAEVAGLAGARQRAQPPGIGRASPPPGQEDIPIYAAPGTPTLVMRLPEDAQTRLTGEVRAPDGQLWYALRLWNAVDGFARADAVAFTPAPDKPAGSGGAPWQPPRPPAQGPFAVAFDVALAADAPLAAAPAADSPTAGTLVAGTSARVAAWATDARGRAWYQVAAGDASGWVLAPTTRAVIPDPLTRTRDGQPLAQVAAGTGMWFTYDTLRQTPPEHLVATARANGFSFLAPETGTSRRGYWAGPDLDRLLVAAHGADLKVIPWVYPWMADLPGDLDLAMRAARHVAPSGDRVDGLGIDIEENLDEGANRAYGQLLRAAVGPDFPLVAITFQPQIASGQRTPFAALAESYNVIAPMSYWHVRPIRYSGEDAYSYVAESIRLIRQRTGRPEVPIAVLGQTFDWFSRNEIGPGNPTGEEVRGSLQAARDLGALGIGYFNWYSTTPEEWEAITAFGW